MSLAAALQQLGATCLFLDTRDHTIRDRVANSGFNVSRTEGIAPGTAEDLKQVLDTALLHECEAIVVDSYDASHEYVMRLRTAGLYVVAIDDLARFAFPCQLVVNCGLQARQLPYSSSSGDTTFLLGPQYALIRPEFWQIPSRAIADRVQNVLVTLGGGDPQNLTPTLLGLLDDLPGDFTVTTIIGPFFENREEVGHAANASRRSVRLLEDPSSMCSLMLEADLAVSAGGQTLYELAATGTPTVGVQVAENQASNLRALAAQGVI